MILCDVNVLVYAHKEGADRHDEYRAWLQDAMNGDEALGVSDLVLSGVLRIVTHPACFRSTQ
ncbi:MAG: PIN domain-containing protein [Pseudonocardiaceae bacterium]